MSLRNITIASILLILWGCSIKKNTWVSRNYHNLTAYYNVYYNGKESFNAGNFAIKKSYKNNYTELLPMFESSDDAAISVAAGDMDRAIEKGGKLIKKHSITAKPKKGSAKSKDPNFYNKKEYNVMVDDAYMLIGKAQFCKHDFSSAVRTFQYVNREFDKTPAQLEALIWLARTHTEQQNWVSALSALESYDLVGSAPIELYGDYMAAYANMLLKQQKYPETIPYLIKAIENCNDRTTRIRFQYILAQLYERTGNRADAAKMYGLVASKTPNYEMSFNAKVNQASIVYDNANLVEVKKQLRKLAKDKKNKEYLDRIYYAYGRVYIQEGNEKEALASFATSVKVSVVDDNRKGMSFREMGNIYYKREDYKNAYFNYDSAIVYIDPNIASFAELEEKHAGLSTLVANMLLVEREDSLQRLATMSEPVLFAYLDGIIKEKIEDEKKQSELKRQAAEEEMYSQFGAENSSSGNNQTASGKWYFYNPTSIAMGKNEFAKRWGKRKLEDNWRRKDRRKMEEEPEDPFEMPDDPFATNDPAANPKRDGAKEGEPKETDQAKKEKEVKGVPTRAQLLADIPISTAQRQESNERIDEALMDNGLIFMDHLNNYPKAVETFNELLRRFPNSRSREAAMVALFNAYRLSNDEAGMLHTRNRLEKEFPSSRFVAFLNDPDFINKMNEAKVARELAYEQTYRAFLFGKFDEVLAASTPIITKNEAPELINKYQLLRSLAYAKRGDKDGFKNDLEIIVTRNTGKQEVLLAKAFLEQLEQGKMPVQGTLYSPLPSDALAKQQRLDGVTRDNTEVSELGFVYVEKEAYDLLVLGIDKENMNRAIYNVADYNFSRFLLADYEISEKGLLEGDKALLVSGFRNKVEAMDYFYSLREKPEFFGFDAMKPESIIIISESNKSKFYLSGMRSEYNLFFQKYYLSIVDKKELEKVSKVVQPTVQPVVEPEASAAPSSPTAPAEQPNVVQPPSPQPVFEVKPEKPSASAFIEPSAPVVVDDVTFVLDKNAPHLATLILPNVRMDYKRLTTIYINYTKTTFGNHLNVEFLDLGSDNKMIEVSGFKNASEAKTYLDAVKANAFLTKDINRMEYYLWIISDANLTTLKSSIELKAYDGFYKLNY